MLEWFQDHQWLVWTLTGVSAFMFVATLIALPIVLTRLPADYFMRTKRRESRSDHWPPVWRTSMRVGKNVLGVIILLAGLAMLVLPGQGLLAILAGLLLMDFPGKFKLERWLVSKSAVQRAINWLRRRAGQPPLQVA